jgi:hypothetical protein
MRKMVHGRKVQNWHHPLGENAKKNGYIRRKDKLWLNHQSEMECRHSDKYEEASCSFCETAERWMQQYSVDHFYEDPRDFYSEYKRNPSRLGLLKLSKDLLSGALLNHAPLLDVDEAAFHSDDLPFEQRLFEHVSLLDSSYGDLRIMSWVFRSLAAQLGRQGRELLEKFSKEEQALVLLYSPFWIRSLAALDKQLESFDQLLEYLFVKEENPQFSLMRMIQVSQENFHDSKWIVCGILLGRQMSLYRASKLFGWNIFGKTQYFVESLLSQLTALEPNEQIPNCEELFEMAEISRMGGTNRLAKTLIEVLRYRELVLDSENSKQLSRDAWADIARFWIRNSQAIEQLDQDSRELMIDWFVHILTEVSGGGIPERWKPNTIAGVLRSARQWFAEINFWRGSIYKPTLSWHSRKLSWRWTNGEDVIWSFQELTSAYELFQEGAALGHCVGSYAGRCHIGSCAIVSLRKNGIPTITIEFDLRRLAVVQARGFKNREATPEERLVIDRWLSIYVRTLEILPF